MPTGIITDAIVLRRAEWRDYDRMVTLFTPEYGVIDCVARGCRRVKSQLMNATEPFCAGEYQLLYSKDRYTITQCRITDSFYSLREDYELLTHGAYWLRLLSEVLTNDTVYTELFGMTLKSLAYLANSGLPPALLTAMFEMRLWRLTGFSPNVSECVVCGRPAENAGLRFDAERGGCVCAVCSPSGKPLSEGARRILLKAPRAPYETISLLQDRPEWQEAANRIREFTFARLGRSIQSAPEAGETNGGQ